MASMLLFLGWGLRLAKIVIANKAQGGPHSGLHAKIHFLLFMNARKYQSFKHTVILSANHLMFLCIANLSQLKSTCLFLFKSTKQKIGLCKIGNSRHSRKFSNNNTTAGSGDWAQKLRRHPTYALWCNHRTCSFLRVLRDLVVRIMEGRDFRRS